VVEMPDLLPPELQTVLYGTYESKYTFTEANPPLMKDVGRDILGIPPGLLKKDVGSSSWKSAPIIENVAVGSFAARAHDVIVSSFKIDRILYWGIEGIPVHYAETVTKEVTTKKGYSRTEKNSMEQSLGVSIGASGFGLSAKVQADLHITHETMQHWQEETTEKITETFNNDTTYVTWVLVDSIDT
jgi:hypothetical protein